MAGKSDEWTKRWLPIVAGTCLAAAVGGAVLWWRQLPPPIPDYREALEPLAQALAERSSGSRGTEHYLDLVLHEPWTLVPELIALLNHEREDVQKRAAASLSRSRDRPELKERTWTEQELDALIAALHRGLWVSDVIAAVDTPRAHAALVDALRRDNSPNSQLIGSIETAGARVALANTLREADEVSSVLLHCMHRCFRGDGSGLPLPVDELSAIAADEAVLLANRIHAVELLGACQTAASGEIQPLRTLAHLNPDAFGKPVQAALLQIEAPDGIAARMGRIRWELANEDSSSREHIEDEVRDLALQGRKSLEAGPLLAELARSPDIEIRNAAVVAIGLVEHREASDVLLDALRDPDDWLLNFRAVAALGRIRATDALGPLQEVAATHWEPRVSAAAQFAIAVLEGRASYPELPDRLLRWEFFDPSNAADLPGIRPREMEEPRWKKRVRLHESRGALTAFQASVMGRRVEKFSIPLRGDAEPVEQSGPINVQCGLRVRGGCVLGEDQGEFGCGLYFVSDDNACTLLAFPNVVGLYRLPIGVVAITTASMIPDGDLWLIDDSAPGVPRARWWKRLPFDPGWGQRIGLRQDGSLYINGLIVTTDGRLKWDDEVDAYLRQVFAPALPE